jgi:hypothetical protein
MATTEQIARIAYEANRTYCKTISDNSFGEWEDAPDWQKETLYNGVRYHMAHHKAGTTPVSSESHENWLAEKERTGWKYGPVKDPEKKEHPCFVPYDQLPPEQRLKDYLFGAIVKAFWEASGETN